MKAAIAPDLFRALLRRHAAGVVVVTVPGTPPAGFTATSFTSVSLHPPLVSFCLSRNASCWPVLAAAGHVGVHMLRRSQEHLARTFATRGIDRFATPTRWRTGRDGVPVLEDVLAVLICRVADLIPAGDHGIVLAEPVEGSYADEDAPLLYHMGRYARVA
jgi:flavin reductase (DIM6/NTAB) family NADH-FMN oxidoreductase RutF